MSQGTIKRQVIVENNQVAFEAGETVEIESVQPNPQNPAIKYVALSQRLQNMFQLSDDDIQLILGDDATRALGGIGGKAKHVVMRPKKDIHYFEKQKKRIVYFINNSKTVKVTIMFSKEEMPSQTEFGLDLLNLLADELSQIATVEAQPTLCGRKMTMIIKPGVSKALGDSDRNFRKSAAEVFPKGAKLPAGREAEANAADAVGEAAGASENALVPPSSWVDQVGNCYRCGESSETCFSMEIIACNGSSRRESPQTIKTTYKDFAPVVLSVCDSCIVKEKLRWRKTAKIGTVLFAISLSIIIPLLFINVGAGTQLGVPLVLLFLLLPGFGMSLFGWGFSYLYVRLERVAESNDIALFEKISKNMNETSLKIMFPDLKERISDMTGRNGYLTLGAYEMLKRKKRIPIN